MIVDTGSAAAWESDPYVVPWPEMRPFWAAAAEGRFMMPRCIACQKYHWHPRPLCPFCRSSDIELVESRGQGTIYSYGIACTWTPPHAVAFVETHEGPVILTKIVDCDLAELRIGLPVRVKLMPVTGGRSLPFFTPHR